MLRPTRFRDTFAVDMLVLTDVRANKRIAALVALYTLSEDSPLLPSMDEFRTIDAPSGNRGSAFCTVIDNPFHIDVENRVVEVLGDRTQTGILRNAGVCEYNIQPVFLVLDLCKEAIQSFETSQCTPVYTSTDFLYCLGQLWFASAGDERVRALVHKSHRRSKSNPAGGSGYHSFRHPLPNPAPPCRSEELDAPRGDRLTC